MSDKKLLCDRCHKQLVANDYSQGMCVACYKEVHNAWPPIVDSAPIEPCYVRINPEIERMIREIHTKLCGE